MIFDKPFIIRMSEIKNVLNKDFVNGLLIISCQFILVIKLNAFFSVRRKTFWGLI